MKIAIVGGGFAGVSVAWHLLALGVKRIELFDEKGIGGGASGMPVALLHPFAGVHSKLNHLGLEGFHASQELFKIASLHLDKPVAEKRAILRQSMSALQNEKFSLAAKKYPEHIHYLQEQEAVNFVQGLPKAPGIIIPNAMAVYAKDYLEGLWQACKSKGAILHKTSINSLDQLSSFNKCIVAAGKSCQSIEKIPNLSLSFIKGQQLEIQWPKNLPPLKITINPQIFCTMGVDNTSCFVGATFERNFTTTLEDRKKAEDELLPKLKEYYPPLYGSKIIGCRAEIRVSAPKRIPCTARINQNTWMFTGLGSKGLLYHALYAKMLAEEILGAS